MKTFATFLLGLCLTAMVVFSVTSEPMGMFWLLVSCAAQGAIVMLVMMGVCGFGDDFEIKARRFRDGMEHPLARAATAVLLVWLCALITPDAHRGAVCIAASILGSFSVVTAILRAVGVLKQRRA